MKLIGTIITKQVKLTYDETLFLRSLFTNNTVINQGVIDYFYNVNLELNFITSESSLPHVISCNVTSDEITIIEQNNFMNSKWQITFILTNEKES